MSECQHLGGGFWKTKDDVIFEGGLVRLDPKNVRVFFGMWATDGRKVYWGGLERKSIDATSFVPLNCLYAKDAKGCFLPHKAIDDADATSFVSLDSGQVDGGYGNCRNHNAGFAKDKLRVYHDGNPVRSADIDTFVSLGDSFGRDRNRVYHERFVLPGVLVDRWRRAGILYSQDDRTVYFQNRKVNSADPLLFQVVGPIESHFGFDGSRYFCAGKETDRKEYASSLRDHARHQMAFADLVASGRYEQNFSDMNWCFREPKNVETMTYHSSSPFATPQQRKAKV